MAFPSQNNVQTQTDTNITTTTQTVVAYTPTSGANGKLVVLVTVRDATNDFNLTGVTYNGSAMVEVANLAADKGTVSGIAAIFELDDPLSIAASGDIVATVDVSHAYNSFTMFAMTLLGAAQNAPAAGEKGTATVQVVSTPISVTVTPGDTDNLILTVVLNQNSTSTYTPTSPHVQIGTTLDRGAIGYTEKSAASAESPEWSAAAGSFLVMAAASFGPAAAGAATVMPGPLMMGMG